MAEPEPDDEPDDEIPTGDAFIERYFIPDLMGPADHH